MNSRAVYFDNPASYLSPLSQPLPHGFVDNLRFFHMWKVPRIFDYDQLGIRDSFGQNRAGILQRHRFICISTYNEGGHLHTGQAVGKVESEEAATSCL